MSNELGRLQVREDTDNHDWEDVGHKATDQALPVSAHQGTPLPISFDFANLTNYDLFVDTTTTADTVYVGYAAKGSATSDSVWQVQKWDISSGIQTRYADDDDEFDNEWDNRATLSYT